MSIASNARAEAVLKRIEQAYAAAEAGDGWMALGALWGCSNQRALQWCQSRLPPDVCARIGENGRSKREKPRCNKYSYSSAQVQAQARAAARPQPNQSCCYQWHERGQGLSRCYAPTNGRTYCEKHNAYLSVRPTGSSYRTMKLFDAF